MASSEYNKAYFQKNKEKSRRVTAEYRKNNYDKIRIIERRAKLKKNFGISIEEYDALLSSQGGVCAICKRKCRARASLAVDHDHLTGKVRGLLCGGCNTSLGQMDDSIEYLQNAINYLEENK